MAKLSSTAWALWWMVLVVTVSACTTLPPVSSGAPTVRINSEAVGAACVPVDDRNPCTDDICEGGVPRSKPAAAGSVCGEGSTRCDGAGSCVLPPCSRTLGFPGVPSPGVGDSPLSVAAADLNGDGKPDLVTANHGSDDVSVLLNTCLR